MQGLGSRGKALAVVTGITTGLGIALLTCNSASKFFQRYLCSSKPPWKMTVRVARTETQCVSLINELQKDIQVSKVVGFDCEWVQVTSRNPVALLQLATTAGQCGLFQIRFYKSIPEALQKLLEDKSILKVGVDPLLDAKFLLKDYNIQVQGAYDIRHLVDVHPGRESVGGLAAIVLAELGVQLSKTFKVRVSDWEAENLTEDQQQYAANDALAGLLAFNKLIDKKVKVPFFCSKDEQWRKINEYCAPLTDVPFRDKKKVVPPVNQNTSKEILKRDKSGQPSASSPIVDGKRSYRAFCPRKSPLYENAFMLAPDGAILCTCDTKKAEWYVSKGLATIVESVPLRIQLTFEPSGRVRGQSGEYYTLEKQNQCVACGKKDGYVRKKIVPHEYRRYFPDCMKKHQSHDVLLLCARCHVQSNVSDLNFRMKLAHLCNAPIVSDENAKVVEDNRNKSLRSAARALINKSNNLPDKRRQELTDFIKESCQSEVTSDLLNSLKDMDIMVPNQDYAPHGLLVVEHFAQDGIIGLMRLEKMWREHFISIMEPKYLPPLWSVDHYHENERDFSFDSDFLSKMELASSKRKLSDHHCGTPKY